MSFTDWTFIQRITEDVDPSEIEYTSETLLPLVGNGSLRIIDHGAPAIATVAFMPNPLLFDTRIEAGHIRMTFDRRSGSGFLDHGFFFLSQGLDPTRDDVVTYVTYVASGGTNIRVMKYTSGLHNTMGSLLANYNLPSAVINRPAVIDVAWVAGLFTRGDEEGVTTISTSYADDTTDFDDLILLGSIDDTTTPLMTGIGPGVFLRSRDSSEPIDSMIDNTYIYRYDVA